MTPSAAPNLYKPHRFPGEIISHAVWLYFRFPLSHRDVEELLFVRGVIVSYEAIREWCRKCGQVYANQLRRQRPQPGDKWHLDEVFLTINGQRHYLWRAVDQDDNVLDILVQSRRNKQAAKKFCRKLLNLSYPLLLTVAQRPMAAFAANRTMAWRTVNAVGGGLGVVGLLIATAPLRSLSLLVSVPFVTAWVILGCPYLLQRLCPRLRHLVQRTGIRAWHPAGNRPR
jgi:transposase-like protein